MKTLFSHNSLLKNKWSPLMQSFFLFFSPSTWCSALFVMPVLVNCCEPTSPLLPVPEHLPCTSPACMILHQQNNDSLSFVSIIYIIYYSSSYNSSDGAIIISYNHQKCIKSFVARTSFILFFGKLKLKNFLVKLIRS